MVEAGGKRYVSLLSSSTFSYFVLGFTLNTINARIVLNLFRGAVIMNQTMKLGVSHASRYGENNFMVYLYGSGHTRG
jgi:hypothetical protein